MIKSWHNHLRTIVIFLTTLVLIWVVASFIHELAHGLTAEILGGRFLWFYVWPGVQV